MFARAFHEVVAPILGDVTTDVKGLKADVKELKADVKGLKADVKELRETVDSHTASLIELEKLPQLVGEVYNEVKGVRPEVRDHEERITKLEKAAHL